MSFFLGYNTNGFAHHHLDDCVDILADLGYKGIAVTPDVHHLDPMNFSGVVTRVTHLGRRLARHNMKCVIETGARFVLDPRRKHQPTLLCDDPSQRMFFLETACEMGWKLDTDVVSFWSGTPDADTPTAECWRRLTDACKRLADFAAERNVKLAFEPEPGMFIDTMPKFAELHAKVNHPAFGLTLDIGHLVCTGELPVSKHIIEWKKYLWNVHIEDMKAGVHDHLSFGTGDVDFPDAFAGLRAANYTGGVYVELSRHSHDAVETARRSLAFLRAASAADAMR